MVRPVNTAQFWRERIAAAPDKRRIVWAGSDIQWDIFEGECRDRLATVISPDCSILDAGCGYGRLLSLLPTSWYTKGHRRYLGVDISPDLLAMARGQYNRGTNTYCFMQVDLSVPPKWWPQKPTFTVAICIMLRHMLLLDMGVDYWHKVEANLKRAAVEILYFEPKEVLAESERMLEG